MELEALDLSFFELSVGEEDEENQDDNFLENNNVLDSSALLHSKLHEFWKHEVDEYRAKALRPQTRGQRAINYSAHRGGASGRSRGDQTMDNIQKLFHTGMDVKWSEVQVDIFNVVINMCLPKIYGSEWNEQKARVLRQRGMSRQRQEALINMARRNGKTFVNAGAAAVLLLMVPDISIAVFSTGERAARMLMDVVRNMIKKAFDNGTIVKNTDFALVQSNKEVMLMEGPDGTKRLLGCYPGSVRVSLSLLSFFSFFFFFLLLSWAGALLKVFLDLRSDKLAVAINQLDDVGAAFNQLVERVDVEALEHLRFFELSRKDELQIIGQPGRDANLAFHLIFRFLGLFRSLFGGLFLGRRWVFDLLVKLALQVFDLLRLVGGHLFGRFRDLFHYLDWSRFVFKNGTVCNGGQQFVENGTCGKRAVHASLPHGVFALVDR